MSDEMHYPRHGMKTKTIKTIIRKKIDDPIIGRG